MKYLNRGKPIVIDFDNDDWIYDPNLFEVQSYEIDKISNYSERSENFEYSIEHSQNDEENKHEFLNDEIEDEDTKSEITEKDQNEKMYR